MSNNLTGLYGKLPAHGDFIYRDLPNQFLGVWDEWLQGYVGSSREQLGENWLDIYLTSPIWRFAFSAGAVDENAWAGVVLPSVDRVGRYFPISVATRLPAQTNPTEFICTRPNWYQTLEEAALRALNGELTTDDLVEELNDSYPMNKNAYARGAPLHSPDRMLAKTQSPDQSPSAVLPFLLDACLTNTMQCYSVWSTKGSQYVSPCMFVSRGLPQFSGIAAMLDGNWSGWQWQEPFVLQAPNGG